MKLFTYILIPTVGNDGVAFTDAVFAAWDAHLIATFGGYSKLPAIIAGAWIGDDNIVYNDDTVVYAIAISSLAEGADVVAAARFALKHFAQLAILVHCAGLSELVEADE